MLILLPALLVASCGKKLVYFQEKEDSKNRLSKINTSTRPVPENHVISAGDVLNFQLHTSNQVFAESLKQSSGSKENVLAPEGITVNESGEIFLSPLGKIKVSGLTLVQAEQQLSDSLSYFINDFKLSLKLGGFRIFALGAVRNPGITYIHGEQATIIEALGYCGDLSDEGKPSDIKIIRDENGIKKTILVDLSDVDLFLSEAYYLQSNDILYVETLPRKFVRENIQYINILASLGNLFTIIFINLRR